MKNTPLKTEELKQQLSEHAARRSPASYQGLWHSLRRIFRNGLDYSEGNPMLALWQHMGTLRQQFRSRSRCQSRKASARNCRSFW